MRWLFVLILVGCASAGSSERSGEPDASVRMDGSAPLTDSGGGTDSTSGCTVVIRNLLTNGNFDAGASGWTVAPIIAGDPIIATNADGGINAQSPTYRAWMGGVEQSPTTNKDSVYQDVMIPATTTALAFTGYYEVRSAETTAPAYDRAVVELASTTNAQIELIKNLDDNGKTTAWTAFNKTIAASVAGQTIRMKLSTSGDGLYATSFYFDTLELTATHCQ